jgi:anti-sigma B factor antagonist
MLSHRPVPTSDFTLRLEAPDSRTRVVAVTGEVDLTAAPDLRDQIGTAIEDGAERVLVDLSGATLVDSSVLGVLVGAMRRLRRRHGDLGLVGGDPAVERVLTVTGLDELLVVAPSRDEALARLAA